MSETKVRLLLEMGRCSHDYGTASDQIEESLVLSGQALGLCIQASATPTALFIAVGEGPDQHTYLQRLEPGRLDDERLSRVQAVMTQVIRGQISSERALRRVQSIKRSRPLYGAAANIASSALLAVASAGFLGGTEREAVVAGAIGFVVGVLLTTGARRPKFRALVEPLVGLAAGTMTLAGEALLGPVSYFVTSFAGIIALVPGVPLTLAIEELSQRHLTAGATRFLGAVSSVAMLALGIGIGLSLKGDLIADIVIPRSERMSWPLEFGAIVVAASGLVIMLRAQPTQTLPIVAVLALGFYGSQSGTDLFQSPILGAAAGAFLVGILSNAYSQGLRRPAAVTTLSGLLFLLPVSFGFRCFEDLSRAEVTDGILAGFHMVCVLVAIVMGLFVASLFVPPYRPRPYRTGTNESEACAMGTPRIRTRPGCPSRHRARSRDTGRLDPPRPRTTRRVG